MRNLFAVENKKTFGWLRNWLLAMVCSGTGFSQGNEMSGIWRLPQFHGGEILFIWLRLKLNSAIKAAPGDWDFIGSSSNQIKSILPLNWNAMFWSAKRGKQNKKQNPDWLCASCSNAIRLGVIQAKAAWLPLPPPCLEQSGRISVTSYHQTIILCLSLIRETLQECTAAFKSQFLTPFMFVVIVMVYCAASTISSNNHSFSIL